MWFSTTEPGFESPYRYQLNPQKKLLKGQSATGAKGQYKTLCARNS
jgi:hypothetical protein